MIARLVSVVLFCLGAWCIGQSQAQVRWGKFQDNGGGTVVVGNNTALDGHSVGSASSGTSCAAGTLTTTNTNDIIYVYSTANGSNITSVTGGGLTFTQRSTSDGTGAIPAELWSATAAGTVSAALTVNYVGSTSFCFAGAFGVSGTASAFDSGAPTHSQTDPLNITTANANDFIVYTGRGSASSTTAGSCCTLIDSPVGSFSWAEYEKVTATGTYSMNIGSVGTANGSIVDAAKSN